MTLRRTLDFSLILFAPALASLFGSKLFDNACSKFLRDTVGYAMAEIEKSGTKRNDLIDALINIRDTAKQSYEKEFDFLVAQAAIFQLAGFETSSSTMTFALFELAQHAKEQELLRKELNEAFGEGNNDSISYEVLQELPYLDQ